MAMRINGGWVGAWWAAASRAAGSGAAVSRALAQRATAWQSAARHTGARRRMAALSLALLLAGSLAGCVPNGQLEPGRQIEPGGAAAETLRILYATVEAGSEAIIYAAERYREETGIVVEVSTFPYNSLQEKVFSELLGESAFYDLVVVDTPWMPKIIQQLEPLSAYIAAAPDAIMLDDFIAKPFLDTAVFKEEEPQQAPPELASIDIEAIVAAGFDVWSLPLQSNVLTVSYRKDLFEDADNRKQFRERYQRELAIPQTLDEYLDVAAFFTRDTDGDGEIDMYGTTLMAAKHESNFVDFKSFLSVYGGAILDEQQRPAFNNARGVAALEAYGSWILEQKVTPPDVMAYTWDEVEIAYSYGQVAMGMNYHDMKLHPKVAGETGYFMMPGLRRDGEIVRGPHFGSWGLAINRHSGQKQQAYALATYLASPQMQQQYLQFRQHVTRTSAYEAAKHLPDRSLREYYEVLGNSLRVGVGRPRIKQYEELSEIMQTAVQRYLAGREHAAALLDEAAAKVAALINEQEQPAAGP